MRCRAGEMSGKMSGYLGKSPDCIAECKVSHTLGKPHFRWILARPKPLGVDPVKPEGSDLCGDDPVSDVEPLAGPKDSPEQLLPISKRPAPVIGLHGFADYGKSFLERFVRAVQRKASAVIEAPWPARIVARTPSTGVGLAALS
jgi:hypothetical protein